MLEIISKLTGFLAETSTSMKGENIRKRLFILECRTNIAIIGMMNFDDAKKQELAYSLITELNYDMSLTLLAHFKNNFLNNILPDFEFLDPEDELEIKSEPKDQLIQIISKIKALHIISKHYSSNNQIPNINVSLRINNLRKILLSSIKATFINK